MTNMRIMKKIFFGLLGLMLIFALASVLGEEAVSEESVSTDHSGINVPPGNITLGFCLTMEKYAFKLKNEHTLLVPFESASEALNALSHDDIDIALIGRVADEYELQPGTKHVRLEEGYTLISTKKRFIPYGSLQNVKIHTALQKKKPNQLPLMP